MIVAGVVLVFHIGFAQNTKIYDINSLKPVNNVYVIKKGNKNSAFGNEKGEVDLSNFSPADTVIIQHPGYLPEVKTVETILSANKTIYLRGKTVDLLEFVVTSNKRKQKKTEVSNQVSRLKAREVELYSPQTSADLLNYSGDVYIQKSQLGGGSPMIRGFSANKVLIVVDGVRMNNAIFRGGNLQNVINVDPLSLESAEVIYGPGSLIYGSDALGGVMSFQTKRPEYSNNDSLFFKGNVMARYSSANSERTAHVDLNFGAKKWAFYSSVSASDFSDLRAGRNRASKYGDFGLREWYVKRDAGQDVIIANSDSNFMISSGYSQLNLMQKIAFKPKPGLEFNYGVIYSTTTDIPRYDRLIETRNGLPRNAEWYCGPQEWLLNKIQLERSNANLFYDRMNVVAAWQHFKESRNDRRFQSDWLRQRTENVDVVSINLDFDKKFSERDEIFYGFEGSYNMVQSEGREVNIQTGAQQAVSSRYPSAGSEIYQSSFYTLYQRKLNPKLTSNIGLRYTWYNLLSDLSDRSFFDFPYEEIQLNTNAVTGNAGLVFTPNRKWQFSSNISSGFRAPNLDDVAKVFDSEPGTVIVPNPNLKPEYAYTGELALIRTLGKNSKLQVNAFYTYAFNAIVRGVSQFNGSDSIMYDATLSQVQTLVNTESAEIYGLSYSAEVYLTDEIGIKSSLSWIQGRDRSSNESLRHVPPLFGATNVFYRRENFYVQLGSRYNGAIAFNDLAPSEQAKTHIYPTEGSLAWYTLDTKLSYEMKTFAVQAGCDNILDRFYWAYSSGISAPGRNWYLSLKFKI